jgi:hypothetical protein
MFDPEGGFEAFEFTPRPGGDAVEGGPFEVEVPAVVCELGGEVALEEETLTEDDGAAVAVAVTVVAWMLIVVTKWNVPAVTGFEDDVWPITVRVEKPSAREYQNHGLWRIVVDLPCKL